MKCGRKGRPLVRRPVKARGTVRRKRNPDVRIGTSRKSHKALVCGEEWL